MTNSSSIFVTVGTTKFDELIKKITEDDVLQELNNKGYNRLILQIGNTNLKPNCSPRCGFTHIESFNLKANIKNDMASADLIISHAGAGSCLEALELNKQLIVVTNDLLMDNHQLELAEQLFNDNYLYYCTCKDLLKLIKTVDLTKLNTFSNDNSFKIAQKINNIMGYNN